MSTGKMSYDPHRSGLSTETIVDWCTRDSVLDNDRLTDVPGVGPALETIFEENGILTIAQLLAHFMEQIDGERDTAEVCQAFYGSVKSMVADTKASRANIHALTFAVANFLAERGMFTYDLN